MNLPASHVAAMPISRTLHHSKRRYTPVVLLAGLSLYACDSEGPSRGGGGQNAATAAPPRPWVGAFRNEQQVGDLFIAVRLVLSDARAEYSVRSTRSGELFATQLCSVDVEAGASVPTLPAMECEVAIGANRAQRTIAFDFSFDGTNWVKRDNGKATVLERVVSASTNVPGTSASSTSASSTNTAGGSAAGVNTGGSNPTSADMAGTGTVVPPTVSKEVSSTSRVALPAGKSAPGSVLGRMERSECARKATGGFTNLPEYMTTLKPDGGQASAWLEAYRRCVDGTPATATAASPSTATSMTRSTSPAPSRSSSTSRGPVPLRIRASCAIEADEDGATEIFLAYGPMDESNGQRLLELWRQSASSLALMAYTRCLNVNWNFK